MPAIVSPSFMATTFEAVDTSENGAVTVGNLRASDRVFPARWTEEGATTLGALSEPGRELGVVNAVNADGSVCVGGSEKLRKAWIWSTAAGIRSLADALQQAGVDTTGWEFHMATGVSGDGKRIAGVGSYRLRPRSFIARLP